MNRLAISLLLVICVSCHSNNKQPLSDIASLDMKETKYQGLENENMYKLFTTEFYELEFNLERIEENAYNLILNMELKNDSYFVSPNAKSDFSGKFRINIEDNEHIKQIGVLDETPLTVEEFDPHPFVNGPVNWVRENTTYKQPLQQLSTDDFEASGTIIFTIEPSCTLEKIPFFIKYSEGKMRVEIARC